MIMESIFSLASPIITNNLLTTITFGKVKNKRSIQFTFNEVNGCPSFVLRISYFSNKVK